MSQTNKASELLAIPSSLVVISEQEFCTINNREHVVTGANGWRSDNLTSCTCYTDFRTGLPVTLGVVDTDGNEVYYKFV